MIKQLVNSLNNLKKNYGDVGIKSSFEDEGVFFNDLVILKNVILKSNTFFSIKIGGCEAKSDLFNCIVLDCDGIVAPMIESEFALQKYMESVKNFGFDILDKNFYINIETITAYNNIDQILDKGKDFLKGIVVGRTDLTNSFGMSKNDVDCDDIFNVVKNIFLKAKEFNLETGMGGNISVNSIEFIKKLFELGLLDYIETRNVILKLNEDNINNLESFVEDAIKFEKLWLDIKTDYYLGIGSLSKQRSDNILKRLNKIDFDSWYREEEEKVISIDFDGVIHNMDKGFHDGTIYGDIIPGTKEALEKLSKEYELIIYTCKANPKRPLINNKTGIQLIWDWLEKNNIKQYIKDITYYKPNAICYIDDKTFRFNSWNETLIEVNKLIL